MCMAMPCHGTSDVAVPGLGHLTEIATSKGLCFMVVVRARRRRPDGGLVPIQLTI